MKFNKIAVLCAFWIISIFRVAAQDIPRDNSHYKDGESGFIWMPDGEGKLKLVDLKQKTKTNSLLRLGELLKYKMFGPTGDETIFGGHNVSYGDVRSLTQSNYDPICPLAVVIHDYGSGTHSWGTRLVYSEFRKTARWNILFVDYEHVSYQSYHTAVSAVPDLGTYVASHINWLLTAAGGYWKNVHIIGLGMGAHIAGVVGRNASWRAGRITGLDPNGPLFTNSPFKLKRSDAYYVEVFHTDYGNIGINQPCGHIDYYPNGGQHPQPRCKDHGCSHFAAVTYFAASINIKDILVANKCTAECTALNNRCGGRALAMGKDSVHKKGVGFFASSVEIV